MELKNLTVGVLSLCCCFLMFLLAMNMVENRHYKRILIDRAEKIIDERLMELEDRFLQAEEKGLSAFDEIDRILRDENTSVEEAKYLLDQLDQRLKEADELIGILSYSGGGE